MFAIDEKNDNREEKNCSYYFLNKIKIYYFFKILKKKRKRKTSKERGNQ